MNQSGRTGPLQRRRELRRQQAVGSPAVGDVVGEGRGAVDGLVSRPSHATAWGRPRPGTPTVADFESVGLSEVEARKAHRSLVQGHSLSFEDACRGVTLWSSSARIRLDEVRMRRLAESFSTATGVES